MPEITDRKRKLKLHVMRKTKHMRSSRRNYYEEPDLFDYVQEDTELTNEFFNWLHLNIIESIQRVCLERLQNPDNGGEKERKELVRP